MNKEINKGTSSNKARIRFQLGHTCGVTVFKVLEQEGIERGCGEIFKGSNGWSVSSFVGVEIEKSEKVVMLRGDEEVWDKDICHFKDLNKEIYNNILETFKELGSLGNTPPKEGDKVLVSRDSTWIDRYYITTLPSYCRYRYVVVNKYYENKYKNGMDVVVEEYAKMKPIQENTFKEIREGIPSEDLGTVFEVEFCLEGLGNNDNDAKGGK